MRYMLLLYSAQDAGPTPGSDEHAAEMNQWFAYTNELAERFAGTPLNVPLHPSPVYEAIAELFNFAVVVSLWRKGEPGPWVVFFTWAGLYGAQRFVLEYFRGDWRGAWLGLSTSQWLTLGMVVAALLFAVRRYRARGARSTP